MRRIIKTNLNINSTQAMPASNVARQQQQQQQQQRSQRTEADRESLRRRASPEQRPRSRGEERTGPPSRHQEHQRLRERSVEPKSGGTRRSRKNRIQYFPPNGRPGGRDDPNRRGLSGARTKWYLRYLSEGMPADEAIRKVMERRAQPPKRLTEAEAKVPPISKSPLDTGKNWVMVEDEEDAPQSSTTTDMIPPVPRRSRDRDRGSPNYSRARSRNDSPPGYSRAEDNREPPEYLRDRSRDSPRCSRERNRASPGGYPRDRSWDPPHDPRERHMESPRRYPSRAGDGMEVSVDWNEPSRAEHSMNNNGRWENRESVAGTSRRSQEENKNMIKVSVMPADYPKVILTPEHLTALEEAILDEVYQGWDTPVQLTGIHFRPGYLVVDCNGPQTAEWTMRVTPKLSAWRGPPLKAAMGDCLPTAHTISVFLPRSAGKADNYLLGLINSQNAFSTDSWAILSRTDESDGVYLDVAIDDRSRQIISENDQKIWFRFGTVPVRTHQPKQPERQPRRDEYRETNQMQRNEMSVAQRHPHSFEGEGANRRNQQDFGGNWR